ncbi:MAG: SAM-dependent methyltransferase [Rhodobacteraceae bacterium]|nr:SAM-dependent methyltransferase [Paracoccaceae bacterium]
MTQTPPKLTDLPARRGAWARADLTRAGFLHDLARAELQERLADVNKTFTAPAIITPFPAAWADLLPGARCIVPGPVLDLEPERHDLIIHAMALHWADDPVGQIVQCRRALKPDGLFLAVAFGGETLTELRQVLAEAEIATLGGLSPRVAPMAELRDMAALLQRAGLALPVSDRVTQTVTYPDARALMHDLRAMGEANTLADRHRKPAPRGLFLRAEAIYAVGFPAFGDPSRIRATFELVFLAGWVPHDSQQKPLRPGSAKTRLADALNVTEFDPNTPNALHPPASEGPKQ